MKIFPHNFNPHSNSGPNKFTRTLFASLINAGKASIASNQSDADVEFCLIQQQLHKVKPMLLRLDGIWFNSDQDFNNQNKPIKFAYQNANAVVFQSAFNKKLTEAWFGEHKNSHVIHNAPDLGLLSRISTTYWDAKFGRDTEVWSCASSWRPHKRLKENVRYFLEHAPDNAVFAVAGGVNLDEAKELLSKDKRIYLMGELDYTSLLALYRRSKVFVHLSYLDHCPNVVVDAQGAGCHVVCSSSGGTSEVVSNGTIILEEEWDFKPIQLYKPPPMDFTKKETLLSHQCLDKKSNIVDCAASYYNVLKRISGV